VRTERSRSSSARERASSASRRAPASTSVSGEAPACPAALGLLGRPQTSPARRPAARRRLRASLATIASSQGRNGAPGVGSADRARHP
jgi:hypothetical protein